MAGIGDAPAVKRQKLEFDFNTVHDHVLKYKEAIKFEQFEIHTDNRPTWASFCFVRIESCNADRSKCFANADCCTRINVFDEDESKRMIINYGRFFNIELIRKLIHDTETNLKEKVTVKQLNAVEKLANFLDKADETAKILKKQLGKQDLRETHWTSVVGTHVLKALAVNQKMIYFGEKPYSCLCGCGAIINFGDTSMGHEEVWHGCVDIILGAVAVVAGAETEEDEGHSVFETKTTRKLDDNDIRMRVLAETIVFAFTQKEDLVPTIFISKNYIKVFMYEKKHDLLFESTNMPLLDINGNVQVNTVFALWLVVNYKYFCTGVRNSHLEVDFKANFLSCLDERKRQIYQNEVKLGGCQNVRSPFLGYNNDAEKFGKFIVD